MNHEKNDSFCDAGNRVGGLLLGPECSLTTNCAASID
jgi:hypothetical protein